MAADGGNSKEEKLADWVKQRIEGLRPKLLDLTRKNPLISTKLSPRSNSYVRVVDELPDVLSFQLSNQKNMRLVPLPPLENDPKDEQSPVFRSALAEATRTDEAYLDAIAKINADSEDAQEKSQRLERELRDRVREALGMPPRQVRGDVSLAQHAKVNGISPSYELPEPSEEHWDGRHQDDDIQTLLLATDLERKMTAVTTRCRTWLQETGINVLQAAFGFLEWQDDKSQTPALAPLVLLPIEISKTKTSQGPEFWLKGLGETGETNLVLAEMLRLDYSIELPPFDGGSVEEYLKAVADLEPENLKWKVRRQVAFGAFPSARMAMYHDLDTEKNNYQRRPIVNQLLGGSEASGDTPFADEYDVDTKAIEAKVPCLVLDADSSQVSTMVDIANGRNLAVEGPPGTGKSQTIVNTIAAAMADGKKILFVAEKMAALEVVKARLEAVGLGEFVLPLQAERSSREVVISSVRDRLEIGSPRPSKVYDDKLARYRKARSELAEYIDIIASKFGTTGLKVYDVLGKAIWSNDTLRDAPSVFLNPPIKAADSYDEGQLQSIRQVGAQLSAARKEIGESEQYWRGVNIETSDALTLDRILNAAKDTQEAASVALTAREAMKPYGFSSDMAVEEVVEVLAILGDIAGSIKHIDASFVAKIGFSGRIPSIIEFLEECALYQSTLCEMDAMFLSCEDEHLPAQIRRLNEICEEANIEKIDPDGLKKILERAERLLSTLAGVHADLEPLRHEISNIDDLTLETMRIAYTIVNMPSRQALAMRSPSNSHPGLMPAFKKAIAFGREAKDQRSELEQRFIIPLDLSPEETLRHSSNLKNAGLFRFLSSDYRTAKRFYQSLCRTPVFERNAAANDLQELALWKEKEIQFKADEQAKSCFGFNFSGLETDFDTFEELLNFYEHVDTEISGHKNRELRSLLKDGELDFILSLPEVPNTSWSGAIGDLPQEIDDLTSSVGSLKTAYEHLYSLRHLFRDPEAVDHKSLSHLAEKVERNIQMKRKLSENMEMADLLQPYFKGASTSQEEIVSHLDVVKTAIQNDTFSDEILRLIEAENVDAALFVLGTVREKDSVLASALGSLSEMTGIPVSRFLGERTLAETQEFLANAAHDDSGLRAHARFSRDRSRMSELGFDWVVDATIDHNDPTDFGKLAEAAVIRAMAMQILQRYGTKLDRYTGAHLDSLRSELADLDRQIIRLARQQLRSKVAHSAAPPQGNGIGPKSTWTEAALLENETSKKKRFVAVRDLTSRAGRALQELKPCWMMSPLAVAQYLPAGKLSFDLCIIDEASQMRPEDAIGALARCKQAMVVGDTNQLPPSNFFQKVLDEGDDEDDEFVDEESILEMANAKFRPCRRLRWHYRSQHSGLIRFSNELIYRNDLVVFPSPSEDLSDTGVSLVSVKGRYRSGVNSEEARTIVEAAIRFMRDYPDRSLGIVTLNQKQRDLLIDELNFAIEKDRRASAYVDDWAKRNDGLETFFVKNLENVQGDERDVIFIGTVYGPEEAGGSVMQRFGPINGKAGRRRLNVLFSRAKQQIVTFTSLKPSDIKSDEHSNPGTYMLKRWLEYSASGVLEASDISYGNTDSDFEDFVIQQLTAMGCEAVPQVGSSGYFIDIGVKHPKWPYGFILAVECDGATYHSSRSARDRDRLRQEVLERLGWKFHRIWSTDWFNDPLREAARLRQAVEARLTELLAQQANYRTHEGAQSFGEADADTTRESDEVDSETTVLANDVLDAGNGENGDEFASFIDVGDQVRIRYLTGKQTVLQVTISDKRNDPANGILHMEEPLAAALIGAEEGDEVEVLIGSYVRTAVIEEVTKAASG